MTQYAHVQKAVEAVTSEELSKACELFEIIKNLRMKFIPQYENGGQLNFNESTLNRALEYHIQDVLDKLESRLPSLKEDNLKKVETTMAKHGLYDAVFQQIILLCSQIAPEMGEIMKTLREVHSSFMTELQQAVCEFVEGSNLLCEDIIEKTNEIQSLKTNLTKMEETLTQLNNEAEIQNKKILELRYHLRDAAYEINALREGQMDPLSKKSETKPSFSTGFPVYGDVKPIVASKSLSPRRSGSYSPSNQYHNSISSINETTPKSKMNSSSEFENGMVHLTQPPEDSVNSPNFHPRTHSIKKYRSQGDITTSPSMDPFGGLSSSSVVSGGQSNASLPRSKLSTSQPLHISSPVQWLYIFRTDVQRAMDDNRCRDITLKECKDKILKLYESKKIANEKAFKGIGNLPIETLEQHTYRTMEKRYGLRSLAVDHAAMLLHAVIKYMEDDNEVKVFQKVFQNEIEEEFHLIQKELTTSLLDLTMVQLMTRNPNKDSNSLQSLLDYKVYQGVIFEEDWHDLVHYLYNNVDATACCVMLKRLAFDMTMSLQDTNKSTNGTKPEVGGESHVPTSPTLTVNIPASSYPIGIVTSHSSPFVPAVKVIPKNMSRNFIIGTTGHPMHPTSHPPLGYDKNNIQDLKRLGYYSPTLRIQVKDQINQISRKDMLKLPYSLFLKTMLDFQLRSHDQYLKKFLDLFRSYDQDHDGVLNAAEFKDFYFAFRRNSVKKASSGNEDPLDNEGMGSPKTSGIIPNSRSMTPNQRSNTPNTMSSYRSKSPNSNVSGYRNKFNVDPMTSKSSNAGKGPANQNNDGIMSNGRDRNNAESTSKREGMMMINEEEELTTFLVIIKQIDPWGSDRITFSSAVTCINRINKDLMVHDRKEDVDNNIHPV